MRWISISTSAAVVTVTAPLPVSVILARLAAVVAFRAVISILPFAVVIVLPFTSAADAVSVVLLLTVTVLALVNLVGEIRTIEGSVEGRILTEMRWDGGFGYDPIFMPDGYNLSYAEFDPLEKNRISHRGKALTSAIHEWGAIFNQI